MVNLEGFEQRRALELPRSRTHGTATAGHTNFLRVCLPTVVCALRAHCLKPSTVYEAWTVFHLGSRDHYMHFVRAAAGTERGRHLGKVIVNSAAEPGFEPSR